MPALRPRGTVYSTGAGRTCPKCGWPVADCHCAASLEEKVPEKLTARLRIEKAGRGGKTVTVIDGLPRNRAFLERLAGEMKRACGTGGSAGESAVELQGDHRERLRAVLAGRGWTVRG
jgi:translation initiation factor 1